MQELTIPDKGEIPGGRQNDCKTAEFKLAVFFWALDKQFK